MGPRSRHRHTSEQDPAFFRSCGRSGGSGALVDACTRCRSTTPVRSTTTGASVRRCEAGSRSPDRGEPCAGWSPSSSASWPGWCCSPPAAGPAAAAGTSYVALGDSYSSGTGTRTYISDGTTCQRSVYAYPSLIATRNSLALNFRACSGAKTPTSPASSSAPLEQHHVLRDAHRGRQRRRVRQRPHRVRQALLGQQLQRGGRPGSVGHQHAAAGRPHHPVRGDQDARSAGQGGRRGLPADLQRRGLQPAHLVLPDRGGPPERHRRPAQRTIQAAVAGRGRADLQQPHGRPSSAMPSATTWSGSTGCPARRRSRSTRTAAATPPATTRWSARRSRARRPATTLSTSQAAVAVEQLAVQQRRYADRDRAIQPAVVTIPDLQSPEIERAAARAGVDLRSRASIDAADRRYAAEAGAGARSAVLAPAGAAHAGEGARGEVLGTRPGAGLTGRAAVGPEAQQGHRQHGADDARDHTGGHPLQRRSGRGAGGPPGAPAAHRRPRDRSGPGPGAYAGPNPAPLQPDTPHARNPVTTTAAAKAAAVTRAMPAIRSPGRIWVRLALAGPHRRQSRIGSGPGAGARPCRAPAHGSSPVSARQRPISHPWVRDDRDDRVDQLTRPGPVDPGGPPSGRLPGERGWWPTLVRSTSATPLVRGGPKWSTSGESRRSPADHGRWLLQIVGDVGREALQHLLVAAVVRPLPQAVAD